MTVPLALGPPEAKLVNKNVHYFFPLLVPRVTHKRSWRFVSGNLKPDANDRNP